MKIQAVGTYVILENLEAPEKMGGLEIPETQKERIRQRPIGRVLSVGAGVNPEGCKEPLAEGDIVIYGQGNAMHMYGLDGNIVWMVDREFIVGFVREDRMASGEELEAISQRRAKIEAEQTVLETQARARANLVVSAGSPVGKPRLVN